MNPKQLKTPLYMLIGETCMPSIETKNYKSIFEEQVVADSLLATGINLHNVIQGNIYSIEENTFYFKNLIPS